MADDVLHEWTVRPTYDGGHVTVIFSSGCGVGNVGNDVRCTDRDAHPQQPDF